MIYGMTGGEAAPTTPRGVRTATTPFGSLERPFDISRLVEAAGACFVARWTTAHYAQLKDTIMRALERRVFSFVEVVSHCPVQYGRRIGISDPVRMIEWFRKMSVSKQQAAEMTREDLAGKIVVGEFVDIDEAELTEEYEKLFERHGNE